MLCIRARLQSCRKPNKTTMGFSPCGTPHTKKYRVTYCARTSPLPLLPSGPGGVGGITSRRTRHLSILPPLPEPEMTRKSRAKQQILRRRLNLPSESSTRSQENPLNLSAPIPAIPLLYFTLLPAHKRSQPDPVWKPNAPSNSPVSDSKSSAIELIPCAVASACHQSIIGKGLIFAGQISSSESFESLFIEGSVEGSINLPTSRVTVGEDGRVTASIAANNIVVMGQVNGNLTAIDRVEIRAQASVTGDVSAPRISVEDGAFLSGHIEVHKTAAKPAATVAPATYVPELHKIALVRSRAASSRIHASLQSA